MEILAEGKDTILVKVSLPDEVSTGECLKDCPDDYTYEECCGDWWAD